MTVRLWSFLALNSLLMILARARRNVWLKREVLCLPHFHLHGSGAWSRQLDDTVDSAAVLALVAEAVAQALVATATRDNVCGSSGSSQVHEHYTRAWRSSSTRYPLRSWNIR